MAENEGARKTGIAYVMCTTPDVCLTGGCPVPYSIISYLDCAEEVVETVRMTEQCALNMDSYLATVVGDEAGGGGGVASGVNLGYCVPITHSPTVRAKGSNVLFHSSEFWMNCPSPTGTGNAKGKLHYAQYEAPPLPIAPDGEIAGNTAPAPPLAGPTPLGIVMGGELDKALPAIKYDLDFLPLIPLKPIIGPGFIVLNNIKLTGEVSLQKQGTFNPTTFSQEGYELEAAQALGGLASSISVGDVHEGGSPTLSGGFSSSTGASSMTYIPPTTMIFGYAAAPVSLTSNSWDVSGQVGAELAMTVIPLPPAKAPETVSSFELATELVKSVAKTAAGVGVYVAGGIVIVAAVAENAAPYLGGPLNDPILIPAGLGLMQWGRIMMMAR